MSEKKLNIALIGAGKISNYHLKGLSGNEDCHLYAICDNAPDGRAQKQAEKYGAEKFCLDYKELLGDPNIDFVIITVPDNSHMEIACAFMRDGKDVAIIANGLLVYEAVKAGEALAELGINAMVINMSTVKPLDNELVLEAARKCGKEGIP